MRILVVGILVWDALVGPVAGLDWETTAWVDSAASGLGRLARTPQRLRIRWPQPSAPDYLACSRCRNPPPPRSASTIPTSDANLSYAPGAGALAEFALPPGFNHLHVASPFALLFLRHHAPILLRNARAAGLTTSLDLGWDRPPNGTRSSIHACPLSIYSSLTRSKLTWCQAPTPAPTLRSRDQTGCYRLSRRWRIRSRFLVPTVDSTGAADYFSGAFIAVRARGRPTPSPHRA